MGSIIHSQSAGRDGAREEGCRILLESYNSTTLRNDFLFFLIRAASIQTAESKPETCPDGWSVTLKGIQEWATHSSGHAATAALATQPFSGLTIIVLKRQALIINTLQLFPSLSLFIQ